jgi:glutathione synthase/RimK-type ligase-like ATP-grasp enzyme
MRGAVSRVAIATASELPHLDEDGPLLLDALARAGVEGVPAVWDDDGVDWSAFDCVVVRSTWDYAPRRDELVAWGHRVEALTRLLNPAAIIAWNTDKRYLGELAAAGIPTVPTQFVAPGEAVTLPDQGEVVVKPTVSAGSRDTARYGAGEHERAQAHLAVLHAAGRTAMVQPYLEAVDEAGETAVLFVGGELSHAIRKGPLLLPGEGFVEGLFAPEDISPREPSEAELALARRVVAATPGGADQLLYARVDLLPGPDGDPVLIEFEVTEPSLFLAHAAGAADRLAAAIARALGARG